VCVQAWIVDSSGSKILFRVCWYLFAIPWHPRRLRNGNDCRSEAAATYTNEPICKYLRRWNIRQLREAQVSHVQVGGNSSRSRGAIAKKDECKRIEKQVMESAITLNHVLYQSRQIVAISKMEWVLLTLCKGDHRLAFAGMLPVYLAGNIRIMPPLDSPTRFLVLGGMKFGYIGYAVTVRMELIVPLVAAVQHENRANPLNATQC
jgi:hypothetical protein